MNVESSILLGNSLTLVGKAVGITISTEIYHEVFKPIARSFGFDDDNGIDWTDEQVAQMANTPLKDLVAIVKKHQEA